MLSQDVKNEFDKVHSAVLEMGAQVNADESRIVKLERSLDVTAKLAVFAVNKLMESTPALKVELDEFMKNRKGNN